MENEFKSVMSEHTDEDLIKIVTAERDSYNPIAIEAAESEIKKRNINTEKFEEIRKTSSIEKEQKNKVDSNLASTSLRFVNYLIDTIAAYITAIIVFIIVGLILPPNDNVFGSLITLILVFGSFFGYYFIMESKYQKSLGKFATKTKVVKLNGDLPNQSDIAIRTLCRFIPFDNISYLFMKNGFHDTLSKTKVIKDKTE